MHLFFYGLLLMLIPSVFAHSAQVEELLEKNERVTEPYLVKVLDKSFWVYPQNFGSNTFPDTSFYAKNIPVNPDETFLEVGSGTGIIAVVIALRTHSNVFAVDINPYAVLNTKANAVLHEVNDRLTAKESDLFSIFSEKDKFDVIFFNVPALDTDKRELTFLEKAIYDPGLQILEKYLDQVPKYLTQRGRFYLGYSPVMEIWQSWRN